MEMKMKIEMDGQWSFKQFNLIFSFFTNCKKKNAKNKTKITKTLFESFGVCVVGLAVVVTYAMAKYSQWLLFLFCEWQTNKGISLSFHHIPFDYFDFRLFILLHCEWLLCFVSFFFSVNLERKFQKKTILANEISLLFSSFFSPEAGPEKKKNTTQREEFDVKYQ